MVVVATICGATVNAFGELEGYVITAGANATVRAIVFNRFLP